MEVDAEVEGSPGMVSVGRGASWSGGEVDGARDGHGGVTTTPVNLKPHDDVKEIDHGEGSEMGPKDGEERDGIGGEHARKLRTRATISPRERAEECESLLGLARGCDSGVRGREWAR